MKNIISEIDLKSFVIGVLLAAVCALLVSGYGRVSAAGAAGAIAADSEGVYVLTDGGTIRYLDKRKCQSSSGCSFGYGL